jgi:hypothetical protein
LKITWAKIIVSEERPKNISSITLETISLSSKVPGIAKPRMREIPIFIKGIYLLGTFLNEPFTNNPTIIHPIIITMPLPKNRSEILVKILSISILLSILL